MRAPKTYGENHSSMRILASLQHFWQRSRRTISVQIIWCCLGLFLLVGLLDLSGVVPRGTSIQFLGLSWVGLFRRLWVHQLVTAPLLHANVIHLAFNMLALWMLGPAVERTLQPRRYVVFSLLCGLASMLGFVLLNWGSGSIVLGYSGVIFGIFVAQAHFFPNNRLIIFYFFPMKMKHAVLVLGAMELYLVVSGEGGGVAHAAHLLGGLAGFVYLRCRDFRMRSAGGANRPWRRNKWVRRFRSNRGPTVPRKL